MVGQQEALKENSVSNLLSRTQWVSASEFHALSDIEVLREVHQRVRQNENAVVLLDLDATLYEVGSRTHQILVEWAGSNHGKSFRGVSEAILQMTPDQLKYSVPETLDFLAHSQQIPAFESDAIESAQEFWFRRFFTSEYLEYDRSYPGASEFAHSLHGLGAQIVYLTGRDEPNMGEGTRRNLIRDGFPWNLHGTFLLMKPSFHMADLEYKKSAANWIRQQGTLVASFENEPPNVVALYELFPDAMHIFVDTVCSQHRALPGRGLYRICSFSF
jgi:hypothetical protein